MKHFNLFSFGKRVSFWIRAVALRAGRITTPARVTKFEPKRAILRILTSLAHLVDALRLLERKISPFSSRIDYGLGVARVIKCFGIMMKIRKVTVNDLEAVARIIVDGWRTVYRGIVADDYLQSLTVAERLERLRRSYRQNGFLVADEDGKVVGFCRYAANNSFTQTVPGVDCEITALYVKPGDKNRGIGTTLFNAAVQDLKSLGKTNMIVWCFKENFPARKFYERMGGKIEVEKTTDLGGNGYAEVGFVYDLSSSPYY